MTVTETAEVLLVLIQEKQAQYHALATGDVIRRVELDAVVAELKTLRDDFQKLVIGEAKPCVSAVCAKRAAPLCGMLRRPGYTEREIAHPAIYELGCTHCTKRVTSYDVSRLLALWQKINI